MICFLALSTEEQLSAKFALTPADAAILKYIATTNNLDAASLSEASGVARSNINQNIIHLVTHGYLLESWTVAKDSQSVTPRPGNSQQTVNMSYEL